MGRLKRAAAAAGFLAWACASHGQTEQAAGSLYFAPTWCPSFAELVDLRALFHVRQDGCCVLSATPRRTLTPEQLAPWAGLRQPAPFPAGTCTGLEPGAAERGQLSTAQLRKDVAVWPDDLLCATYGQTLRSTPLIDYPHAHGARRIVQAQIRARRLSVNEALAKGENIRIGANSCTLFAAWGLPEDQNRTTNRRGQSIQHVYGDTFVYTDNGVITTIQD